jgi:transposase
MVGAGCAVLDPILKRFEAHVFAADRLHGDDSVLQAPTERMFNMN